MNARNAPRRVLVLNAGSSTLKWTLFETPEGSGECVTESWVSAQANDRRDQIGRLLDRLGGVDAVGHRLVHGGPLFRSSVRLSAAVRTQLGRLESLAPLHLPAALAGIDAVTSALPRVVQIAAFDTSFHATLPEAAAVYALPAEWTRRWKLRRYGFHGLSVDWSVRRAQQLLGALPQRLIVCHLGNGCSITAVEDGRSIDTTMGFSPLEGPAMGTRSGSVDPGLLLHLLIERGVSTQALRTALEYGSGLLGLSGVSGDFHIVQQAAAAGNAQAKLALDHFTLGLRRAIGSMCGVLGGANALVFTGGIGEHRALLRHALAAAIPGCVLDESANERAGGDAVISAAGSHIQALVVTAREDCVIRDELERVLAIEPDVDLRQRAAQMRSVDANCRYRAPGH